MSFGAGFNESVDNLISLLIKLTHADKLSLEQSSLVSSFAKSKVYNRAVICVHVHACESYLRSKKCHPVTNMLCWIA
jgi:hypothetical protein